MTHVREMAARFREGKQLARGHTVGTGLPREELTVDAAELVAHVLTVILPVALPAAVDTGPIRALELIRPARGHSWERQDTCCFFSRSSEENKLAPSKQQFPGCLGHQGQHITGKILEVKKHAPPPP